ncbi:MAG: hypothetical protein KKA62_01920 [Nanoarchaeota archaeon]|nr:hypothetical protein [Nanoarchaeota archaeon]MBU1644567.1 hypothetical protein [Nanoarchaeota archaeon]MBU1976691.1 hypothetical protein [Nanoarchaeota archaeon]
MDYLKKGLSSTISSIQKHKVLFGAIVLVQVVFLVLFLFLAIFYQVKIVSNAKGIIDPLQSANYDADSIEQGKPFSDDLTSIFDSYQAMIKNIRNFVFLALLLFVFFNGALWISTHWLLEERKTSWKQRIRLSLKMWLKFLAAIAVFVLPFFMVAYYFLVFLLRWEISLTGYLTSLKVVAALSVIFYYFSIAAFALINYGSWKSFLSNLFKSSIKKVHRSLLVLIINLSLFSLSIYLIYLSVIFEASLFLLLILGFLFTVILVLTRIFWVASLNEVIRKKVIPHENNNN